MSPGEKISPIISTTLANLKARGIDGTNAHRMNMKERNNSPPVRSDAQGRIGLLFDVRNVSPSLTRFLEERGGQVFLALHVAKLISVTMPVDTVGEVAHHGEVRSVNEETGSVFNIGSVTTEGDSIRHTKNIRAGLQIMGENVSVISDGCGSVGRSVRAGDLPPTLWAADFTFLPPAGNSNDENYL